MERLRTIAETAHEATVFFVATLLWRVIAFHARQSMRMALDWTYSIGMQERQLSRPLALVAQGTSHSGAY